METERLLWLRPAIAPPLKTHRHKSASIGAACRPESGLCARLCNSVEQNQKKKNISMDFKGPANYWEQQLSILRVGNDKQHSSTASERGLLRRRGTPESGTGRSFSGAKPNNTRQKRMFIYLSSYFLLIKCNQSGQVPVPPPSRRNTKCVFAL